MKILIIFLLITFGNNLFGQNTFNEFLNCFVTYQWDSIPENIRTIKKGANINIDKANIFMWGDHSKLKIKAPGFLYERNPPFYLTLNGEYVKSDQGKFIYSTMGFDSLLHFILQPVLKVYLPNKLVMLVTYYKSWDAETGWLEFYEAYTCHLTDEQLLSSICLWTNKKFCVSFKKKDLKFIVYEQLFYSDDGNPGIDKSTICKIIYQLRDDGYFQQVDNTDAQLLGSVFFCKTYDKNGLTNAYNNPDLKSTVVYKIRNGDPICVEKINNGWYQVIRYIIGNDEFHGGFIQKDKLEK